MAIHKCKKCIWSNKVSNSLLDCIFPRCIIREDIPEQVTATKENIVVPKARTLVMIEEKGVKEMCPRKPRKPCSFRGCSEVTEERYCEKHQKQVDSEYNKTSRPFKHLYSTSRWKKLRKQFLQEHPLCVECKFKGAIKAVTVVDHIEAHKDDEESNWQLM